MHWFFTTQNIAEVAQRWYNTRLSSHRNFYWL